MPTGARNPVGTTQPPDGGHRVGLGAGLRALALIALAALGLVAIRDLGAVDRGPAKTAAPSAAAARSEAPASPAPTERVTPKRATVAILVRDDRDRPVPEAVVDVLSAGGRTYDPPATGVTDVEGRVRLSVPDVAEGHRVEVRPSVLWSPADGAAQVVPWEQVGPGLAGEPEASVRAWYPARVESWRAPWPVVRVRSWVRARVTVHSEAQDPKSLSMPAPGVRVAVRLGEGDPNEFLRVTTTGVDGEASFWLWTPDRVTVIALSNASDRYSDETFLVPDAPRGELLLRRQVYPYMSLPEAETQRALLIRMLEAERARRALERSRDR
jgi:hypothetical protein